MGQKRKMSRGEVLAMQGIMKNLGFYLGETGPLGNGVDGDWGPLSKAASTKLDSLLKEGYSDQEIFQHNISDGKRREYEEEHARMWKKVKKEESKSDTLDLSGGYSKSGKTGRQY